MKRGIDIQCVHLAEHFLSDVEHTEAELQDLADMIQSVVDDFFFRRAPRAALDRDAVLNFSVLFDAAKRCAAAGDWAGAESKTKAALAVIRRVLSRCDEPQPDTFSGD